MVSKEYNCQNNLLAYKYEQKLIILKKSDTIYANSIFLQLYFYKSVKPGQQSAKKFS